MRKISNCVFSFLFVLFSIFSQKPVLASDGETAPSSVNVLRQQESFLSSLSSLRDNGLSNQEVNQLVSHWIQHVEARSEARVRSAHHFARLIELGFNFIDIEASLEETREHYRKIAPLSQGVISYYSTKDPERFSQAVLENPEALDKKLRFLIASLRSLASRDGLKGERNTGAIQLEYAAAMWQLLMDEEEARAADGLSLESNQGNGIYFQHGPSDESYFRLVLKKGELFVWRDKISFRPVSSPTHSYPFFSIDFDHGQNIHFKFNDAVDSFSRKMRIPLFEIPLLLKAYLKVQPEQFVRLVPSLLDSYLSTAKKLESLEEKRDLAKVAFENELSHQAEKFVVVDALFEALSAVHVLARNYNRQSNLGAFSFDADSLDAYMRSDLGCEYYLTPGLTASGRDQRDGPKPKS